MDKTVLLSWRSHDHNRVVHAPIVYAAVAIADTDEAYGAAAAEKMLLLIQINVIMRFGCTRGGAGWCSDAG